MGEDKERLGLKTLTTGTLTVVYGNLIQALGGTLVLSEIFNPKGLREDILKSYGVTLITAGAAIISIGGDRYFMVKKYINGQYKCCLIARRQNRTITIN